MQKPGARRDMLVVVCGLMLAVAGPARGNDSGSELASGGIVLVKNDVIAMQREDLSLSPAEVRVRYQMRNDSGKPLTLRVAFTLPEVPAVSPGRKPRRPHHDDGRLQHPDGRASASELPRISRPGRPARG